MSRRMWDADQLAHLTPAEAALAARAVFWWALLPAAARLTHEIAAGRDATTTVRELRAAVQLLDTLGWPDDVPAPAELTGPEAEVVWRAARVELVHGMDPDATARHRFARGPADEPREGGAPVRRLLKRLEDACA